MVQYLGQPPIISKTHSTTLVEVRVIKDVGDLLLDDAETVSFTKDKRLFLDRMDAENLIRQGIVEHID